MEISKEQEKLYLESMESAKQQMLEIDHKMEEELQKVRQKLAEIQESKKYYQQIYEATAQLLGNSIEQENPAKETEETEIEIAG